MKLDKRILEGKKPLDCFDVEEAKQFIGKECYLSNSIADYADLNNVTAKRILDYVSNTGIPYGSNPAGIYCYCLPCEWLEEEKKEPKYRPFKDHAEYKEYLNDGIIESWIQIREKPTGEVSELMYVGGSEAIICLGAYSFDLNDLFYDFELFNESTGEWQPFGIKE